MHYDRIRDAGHGGYLLQQSTRPQTSATGSPTRPSRRPLDLRKVPRLVAPRWECGERLYQRRNARYDHAVLALELGGVFGSVLLGV